jgi:hypothetical protein
MTAKRRVNIFGVFVALAFILYGAAKYYSPFLVYHVVEQSLIQKAPAGTDSAQIQKRLHAALATAPDQNAQMRRLLRISEYLEKVQLLTPEELDKLTAIEKP